MHPPAAAFNFTAWQNFYVLIGSSAGGLIGLQFVVIALLANMRSAADAGAINAFGTPTVVHFSVALIVSAFMNVPWPASWAGSLALVFCGVCGIGSMCRALGHVRRQSNYRPLFEDWVWYTGVPFALYAGLAVAAAFLNEARGACLFGVACATLGLLLLGIRNAWDTVTHLVVTQAEKAVLATAQSGRAEAAAPPSP